MTTFAPNQDTRRELHELEERARRAWKDYSGSLRDLTGREYEDAEHASWDRLQRELRDVGDRRAALTGERPPEPAAER